MSAYIINYQLNGESLERDFKINAKNTQLAVKKLQRYLKNNREQLETLVLRGIKTIFFGY
jgi:hypothetical protein